MRAGYGLAYQRRGLHRAVPRRLQLSRRALNQAFTVPTDGNQNWGWLSTLGEGIPFIALPPDELRAAVDLPVDTSSNTRTMVPETVIRPRIHSYNLAFERQLPYSMSVDVAYVGNRSNGQWTDFNVNASTVMGPPCAVNSTDPSDITCPSFSNNGVTGLNSLRPYVSHLDANGTRVPTINPKTGLPYPSPLNIQTFNAYTGFNKRPVQLAADLDAPAVPAGAAADGRLHAGEAAQLQPRLHDAGVRTTATGGRPGARTSSRASFIYMLPWQTGRGSGGILRAIINDWQVNGICQIYSGSRFTVTADATS